MRVAAVVVLAACSSPHGASGGDAAPSSDVRPVGDAIGATDAASDGGTTCSDGVPLFSCGASTCAEGEACIAGACAPRICTTDRWCWEYPRPQGNDVHGAWGAWLVGDFGMTLHWDGMRWIGLPPVTTATLRSASGGIAVGDGGVMLRFEGCTWQPMTSPTTADLYAVSVKGTDVWIAGASYVGHFDGAQWTSYPLPSTTLYGIWAAAANDVWVVGPKGQIGHFDGTSWSINSSNLSIDYTAVWGTASNDVWFVGTGGQVQHWKGTGYDPYLVGTGTLSAVGGTASNDIWAAGSGGFYHWGGSGWTQQGTLLRNINALTVVGGEVWFAGANGVTTHWDGLSLSDFGATLLPGNLDRMHVIAANNVLLSGTNAVLEWDGSTFGSGATPSNLEWTGITGTSTSEYWICGPNELHHWNGTMWSYNTNCFDREVWGLASDDVYVSGGANIDSFHWNGTGLSQITGKRFFGFHGLASNDVWAVGSSTVTHWNGSSWTATAVGAADLYGIYERSSSEVWAVGYQGAAMYDGSWHAFTLTSSPALWLKHVWSDVPGHAIAVGRIGYGTGTGIVMESDGLTWTQPAVRVNGSLNDIAQVGTDTWIVGDRGTLLIQRP